MQQKARQDASDERLREHARRRGAKSAADLKAKQDARRRQAIEARRQQLAIIHASERMALHAVHKAEEGKLFNIVAGKVFTLFDRVPALRSVIAHLRRNPVINAEERHRVENEALDRRHDRERQGIDRRAAALDKIEARERRGLIRDLVRETRVEDRLREAQTDQWTREMRQTAVEITSERPDSEGREKADDRRTRMQQRLEQARQRPQRGQPGWE